jgi:hypothetical protein
MEFVDREGPSRPFLFALSVVAITLLACGKIKEKIAEKVVEKTVEAQTGTDVDIEEGRVSVKDDKGNNHEWGAGTKLPDDWPKDLGPYPGAKLVGSYSTRQNGKLTGSLAMTVKASPDQVFDHYQAKLDGFTFKSETNFNGNRIKQFVKDKRQVTVTVTPDDRATRVNLVLANY